MVVSHQSSATSIGEEFLRLNNKRGSNWRSIVFGYPIAPAANSARQLPGDHPTLLTLASFSCKCTAAALLLSPSVSIWWAVLLLQANTVFDSMDGTLTRARKSFTRVGAFLDKTTDAIGLFLILTAVGWRAASEGGEPLWIAAGAGAGAAYLALCYMHWLARALTKPPSQTEVAGIVATTPSWREIKREWLAGWSRIVRFQEAELYFWIALFAVIGRFDVAVALAFVTQLIGLAIRIVTHIRFLTTVDRPRERSLQTSRRGRCRDGLEARSGDREPAQVHGRREWNAATFPHACELRETRHRRSRDDHRPPRRLRSRGVWSWRCAVRMQTHLRLCPGL